MPIRRPLPALLALILAAGLSVDASHSQAQTVLNPSFELPALAAGNAVGGSGDSWTPSSSSINYTATITNGYGYGTTPYGNQWFGFVAGQSDSQAISGFALATPYSFTLACADLAGATGDQLTMTVSGGGLPVPATETFAVPARNTSSGLRGALPFADYSLGFVPLTSAPVTISFASVSGTLVVDNVRLAPNAVATVPDTGGTLLLMGLGCAGLLAAGGVRRASAGAV